MWRRAFVHFHSVHMLRINHCVIYDEEFVGWKFHNEEIEEIMMKKKQISFRFFDMFRQRAKVRPPSDVTSPNPSNTHVRSIGKNTSKCCIGFSLQGCVFDSDTSDTCSEVISDFAMQTKGAKEKMGYIITNNNNIRNLKLGSL